MIRIRRNKAKKGDEEVKRRPNLAFSVQRAVPLSHGDSALSNCIQSLFSAGGFVSVARGPSLLLPQKSTGETRQGGAAEEQLVGVAATGGVDVDSGRGLDEAEGGPARGGGDGLRACGGAGACSDSLFVGSILVLIDLWLVAFCLSFYRR